MRWDSDARDRALTAANKVASRDPEAASLLIAQTIAEEEYAKEPGYIEPEIFTHKYDPAEIYDRACYEYKWTPEVCDKMHYLRFFAMLDRANERRRKENESYNKEG